VLRDYLVKFDQLVQHHARVRYKDDQHLFAAEPDELNVLQCSLRFCRRHHTPVWWKVSPGLARFLHDMAQVTALHHRRLFEVLLDLLPVAVETNERIDIIAVSLVRRHPPADV